MCRPMEEAGPHCVCRAVFVVCGVVRVFYPSSGPTGVGAFPYDFVRCFLDSAVEPFGGRQGLYLVSRRAIDDKVHYHEACPMEG